VVKKFKSYYKSLQNIVVNSLNNMALNVANIILLKFFFIDDNRTFQIGNNFHYRRSEFIRELPPINMEII
jgi:hypothetical protein